MPEEILLLKSRDPSTQRHLEARRRRIVCANIAPVTIEALGHEYTLIAECRDLGACGGKCMASNNVA